MASSDSRPQPLKNTAYRLLLAIRKDDGSLIQGWTGADSEVSLDGAGFTDCTNEATEIGTSGCGYLDLTASEMNADGVLVKITVTNQRALKQVFAFAPQKATDRDVLIDGFWDEVLSGHATAGTAGKVLADAATAAALTTVAGYVDTEVAAIKAKTDNLPSDPADESLIQATLATLATAANLATLTGYVDTEVAAIKVKTDALPASPAATTDIPTAATIADAVWDEPIAGHGAAGSTGEALNDAAAGSGGGGGASAADIADAVWDEALVSHVTAGSAGAALGDASTGGDPWGTALPGAYAAGTAGKILGSNLIVPTSSLATAANLATLTGYVDTEVAAIKAKTDGLPSDPADQSALTATMATLATAANLATLTGYVDTEVAAIKAKTDLLPASPASEATLATLATAANLAIVDGVVDAILLDTAALDARVPAVPAQQGTLVTIGSYVDTEVAAIKAKTDALPASPAAVGDIPSAISIADALLDRADGIETALTPRQAMRLMAAALAGKLSGAGTTTISIRNVGDTKDRITAVVTTAGDRVAVTTDLT